MASAAAANPPQPAWKRAWAKLDIDLPTALTMAKGGLPPAIVIAMMQSTSVAREYTTLGYLVSIISALSICIFPRAKLIQVSITNCLAICLAAATSLFGMWTATRARADAPYPQGRLYNPSQATIAGFWLFINIWAVNTIRARNPLQAFPVIFYTIFISVLYTTSGATYMMPQILIIVRTLIKSFLTGIAVALAVGLLIKPLTHRDVWQKVVTGYLATSKKLLMEQKRFLQTHEEAGSFGDPEQNEPLKAIQKAHSDLFAKMNAELPMAKRETAYAHFNSKEMGEFFRLIRETVLPLQGMTVILDILARMHEQQYCSDNMPDWNPGKEHMATVMRTLHEPYETIVTANCEAIQHILLTADLVKPAKNPQRDEEGATAQGEPGTAGFAAVLEATIQGFLESRTDKLQQFFDLEGVTPGSEDTQVNLEKKIQEKIEQQRSQLYLILFMEYLLYSAARSIQDLVHFVDRKKADGVLARRRIVFPNAKRFKQWLSGILNGSGEDEVAECSEPGSACAVQSGLYGRGKLDAEHLPAANWAQKIGAFFASIGEILGSKESGFGLRVATATIACAMPAFFESTHAWFIEKRAVWALIIIAIGMSPTSGASFLGFAGRIFGTALALVFALINWYIVDAHTAGVIAFLWIFASIYMYFVLKYPVLIQAVLTAMITHIMIIGYELQVRKIGQVAAAATGQPFLNIRAIGPYRVLTTLAGIGIAFIFTIFPYPISTRAQIRRDVSASLALLARYYVCGIRIVRMRVHSTGGDPLKKGSPAHHSQKVANKLLTESIAAYDGLRKNLEFTKWEPSLRGAFPRETYADIIETAAATTNYVSIIRYASHTFTRPGQESTARQAWVADLSALLKQVNLRQHQTASIMVLLSSSIGAAMPLPPYMDLPEPFTLVRALEARDPSILGRCHLKEPGFIAFAVIQVAATALGMDLRRLISRVRRLVGQVQFDTPDVGSRSTVGDESTVAGEDGAGTEEGTLGAGSIGMEEEETAALEERREKEE